MSALMSWKLHRLSRPGLIITSEKDNCFKAAIASEVILTINAA
jgi:hypothetical protein